MESFVFKVRSVEQLLELPFPDWANEKLLRKAALEVFTQRGFVDLKLSEVKLVR